MLKGYDRYVTQWDTRSVVQYSLPERYLLLRMLSQTNRDVFVRATLPPSTLFADRALLRRGYSISEPNALVETVSKYKDLY